MYGRAEPRKPFRTLVSEHIIATLMSAVAGQSPDKKGNNVLVVDDFALSIINAAVSHNDLLKAGFMTVCPLETKKQLADGMRRRRYEHLDALYFMRPKKSNLTRVTDDYVAPPPQDMRDLFEKLFPCIFRGIKDVEEEPAMYAECRLLVIPGLPQRDGVSNTDLAYEWLDNQIHARGQEMERLRRCWITEGPTRECVVEVMAYEPSLFSLDMPDTLSKVYTHKLAAGVLEEEQMLEVRDGVYDHLDTTAYRVMSACITLNEYPYIRFSQSPRGVSEMVARSLAKFLKRYREEHPGFIPWGDPKGARDDDIMGPGARGILRPGEPSEPATVIIVDRIDDIAPALLHDITYSCLATDLLGHEPCTPFRYTYRKGGNTVEKDVLLDDADPVWRLLRHEDMGTVIDSVDEGVRAGNARADARRELDPQDVNDLRELMAAVTGDEKLVSEKFSQHYRMKAQIVDGFEKRALHEVCTLQQVLVTGCDADGNAVKAKEIEARMRALMQDDRLTGEDQARLMALWILCAKSVDVPLRNELLAISHIGRKHQTALLNLTDMNVPTQRKSSEPRSDSAPFFDDESVKRNRKAAEATKKLCRYVTKLEDVVTLAAAGTLPEDTYPWVRPPPVKGSGVGQYDPSSLPSAMIASKAAHGEVVNRFTAEVLAESRGSSKVAAKRRVKGSRFAKDGELEGGSVGVGGGGATPGGGGRSGGTLEATDPFSRALEPPKPRLYGGGRILVFVVGGVTQLEIAAMDRLSHTTGREVVVGGTSLLTARDFLDQAYLAEPSAEDDDDEGGGFNYAGMDEF